MPVAWEGEIPDQYVSTGEHVKAVSVSVMPKTASGWELHSRCQTPPKGGGISWGSHNAAAATAGPQLRLVTRLSEHCSQDRGLGYSATPRLAPCAHLRVEAKHNHCDWSTWEAHTTRSQLKSRPMFYVPLQYYFLPNSFLYLFSVLPTKQKTYWNPKTHPLSNLHQALQGASSGQLPASGCFLQHVLLTYANYEG